MGGCGAVGAVVGLGFKRRAEGRAGGGAVSIGFVWLNARSPCWLSRGV